MHTKKYTYIHPYGYSQVIAMRSLANLFFFDSLAAAHAASALFTGQATRWDSNQELDWFVSNTPASCQNLHLENDHVSNHIGASLTFKKSFQASQSYRLKPQPEWPQPCFLDQDKWKTLLRTAWHKSQETAEARPLSGPG